MIRSIKQPANKIGRFFKKNWLWLSLLIAGIIAFKPIVDTIKNIFNMTSDTTKKVSDSVGGVLDTLGIGSSSGQDVYKKLSSEQNGYWNPAFKKYAPSGHKLLTYAAKEQFAKTIKDSWGFVAKDFDATMGVFKQMSTKTQVSDLADYFFQKYNKDLLTYLRPATWSLSFRNYPTSEQFLYLTNYTDNLKSY